MIAAGPAAIAARVAGLALLLAPPARGAERMPGLPEELAITRSIDVQDEDEFQTSLSARHLRLPHERSTTVRAEVEYGVTDRVQAIVGLPYGVRDPAGQPSVNGLEDLELGFRYALLDFRTRPLALDVGLTLGLPTGSWRKTLGAGDVSLEPNFTLSRWLGRVNGQLSFAWRRSGIGGGAEADDLEYGVALLYPWREWFLTFEGAGETKESETAYYAVPELVYGFESPVDAVLAMTDGLDTLVDLRGRSHVRMLRADLQGLGTVELAKLPRCASVFPLRSPAEALVSGWDVCSPASRTCPARRAVPGHPLTGDRAATRLGA